LTSSTEGILEASVSTSAQTVLSSLTPLDVKVMDAIIRRASSATTFLTVFKAYNAVLKEFNLNAEEDVIYYKFLLKLGVVKGLTWGDKWAAAKSQHGYQEEELSARRNSGIRYNNSILPRITTNWDPLNKGFVENAESVNPDTKSWMFNDGYLDPRQAMLHPAVSRHDNTKPSLHSYTKNKSNITTVVHSEPSTSSTLIQTPLRVFGSNSNVSSRLRQGKLLNGGFITQPQRLSCAKPASKSFDDQQENDAWTKLRLAGHEQVADDFHIRNLVVKCFDVWRRGAHWISVFILHHILSVILTIN
jgi:hypothetical protein